VARSAVWIVTLVLGCYSPRLPEGAPCASDGDCPAPQRCVAGVSCGTGTASDASIDTAVDTAVAEPDAFVVDAPPPIDAPDAPPIDSAPVCVAAGLDCPTATVFLCGSSCWAHCSTAKTRDAAATLCGAWGGHLGEIDDMAEQTCAAAKLQGAFAWIGGVQQPGQTSPDAGWTWNGTRPMVFQSWAAGKPDDGGGENGSEQCLNMQPSGPWDDVECNRAQAFFCER
jgi:hypothetical protein